MKGWISKFISAAGVAGICLSAVASVHAWQLPVEVAVSSDTGEKTYIKMVVGLEKGATDVVDNLWDAPALASHPDPDRGLLLNAYIEGKGKTGKSERLWKDIRGTGNTVSTEWSITIDPIPAGKKVSVQWSVPDGMFGAGERLVLKDNTTLGMDGRPAETDMLDSQGYEYTSDGDGGKKLSLVYSKETSGKSSSGSGFGCGTVKGSGGDSAGSGTAVLMFIILFSPNILRLLRTSR